MSASEGLVQRSGTTFRYVCPTRFGDELSPPALSLDGSTTFVVGKDDLWVLAADGTATAQHRPDLSRSAVVGLVASRTRLYAFRFVGGRTEIVGLSPASEGALWSDAGPYDSLSAAEDGFWVAKRAGGVGHARHVDPSGNVVDERTFALELGDIVNGVAVLDGTPYVAVLTADLAGKLLRVDVDGGTSLVLDASSPVDGPVLAGSRAFAVADGVLYDVGGGTASPLGDAGRATCIGQVGDLGYLCSRTKLFALSEQGPSELLVDLATLEEPDLEAVDPSKRDDCRAQWSVFRNHLAAIGALAAADAGADASTEDGARSHDGDGGCTVVRPAGAPRAPILLATGIGVSIVIRRRGRRRSPLTPRRSARPRT